jgi:hypothetical protein
VYLVDYNDLDVAIQKYFGRKDYECVAAQEWNNYSSYEFDVTDELDRYDEIYIDDFRSGKRYAYSLHSLLNKMCKDNIIEPGKYIIQVYW